MMWNRSRTWACIVVVLLVVGVGVAGQAMTAAATPAAGQTSPGRILFEDDFTGAAGSAPDPARWTDYSACSYNSTAAFGSITCGDNEKLDGAGHLVVPATPQAGSAIRTGDRFTFQYGTMSAWIKFPPQAGYWPAFWSLNSRPDGRSETPVGEVDAVEGYTTWLDAYHAAAHSYAADGSRYESSDHLCAEDDDEDVDLSAEFHKYSARIEPGKITFFFDDERCGAVHTKAAGKPWAFGPDVTRGNWLILDLAVGGAGGQQKKATASARMLVDRVEVRALESAPTATTAPTTPPTTTAAASTTKPTATTKQAATTAPGATTAPAATGTAAPGAEATVRSGVVYRLVNPCGGMVLEVPAATSGAGAPLKTGVWAGRDGQRWRPVSVGAGYFKLLNVGTGQAVNVAYASRADGATVIQYPDVSGANAEWRITPTGGGAQQLTAHHSGKALDVRGAAAGSGAAVDQAGPAAGCAQQWSFVRS